MNNVKDCPPSSDSVSPANDCIASTPVAQETKLIDPIAVLTLVSDTSSSFFVLLLGDLLSREDSSTMTLLSSSSTA